MSQIDRIRKIKQLNEILLEEMPCYCREAKEVPLDMKAQRGLLRSLMNLRPPGKLKPEYIWLQDQLLCEEREEKGVVLVAELLPTEYDSRLYLWQGDITRLDADAIVNAANNQMLGCFFPCHGCIDNAIHSAAGLQLREECAGIMARHRANISGYEEPTGSVQVTGGYNLPAKFVFHTVGPIIYDEVRERDRKLLASCYRSCMIAAHERGLNNIAFCCISTGEFRFPNKEAAEIAVVTVKKFLEEYPSTTIKKVIFNVFKDLDAEIYRGLLG